MEYVIKKPYTRGIQKEFNRILFQDAKMVGTQPEFNLSQIDEATEFLVRTLYEITQEEIDGMDPEVFRLLADAVGKLSSPKS